MGPEGGPELLRVLLGGFRLRPCKACFIPSSLVFPDKLFNVALDKLVISPIALRHGRTLCSRKSK